MAKEEQSKNNNKTNLGRSSNEWAKHSKSEFMCTVKWRGANDIVIVCKAGALASAKFVSKINAFTQFRDTVAKADSLFSCSVDW